ncbi:hypothetical protein DM01DRAFT_323901 [Hesseltinella vesiculosa]|uniref:Tetraspanin n=1 Tax=Hesseltinella vesiculosa TaxID=101127 RepID=A0A1X2GDZ6_9FUNG|nr:hypothetical protein DM01DRAFT_323901 [Hesseltinella vesiculosa]
MYPPRLSKYLLMLTTCLVAGLGIAFMVVAIIGGTNNFKGANLFPPSAFLLAGVLGATIFITAMLGFAAMVYPRRLIIYTSIFTILTASILQTVAGILIHRAEANPFGYLWDRWHSNDENYRAYLQDEFTCCGYASVFDGPVISSHCPNYGFLPASPCFYSLTNFIDNHFYQAHRFVFSTLCIDFMALISAIAMLCMLAPRHPPFQAVQPVKGYQEPLQERILSV